jgi:hypothetical protein
MTLEETIERYIAMPEERKAQFLVRTSYELTVYMRGCYVDDPDPELRATKLKGTNEIQHQLASEAGHHLAGNLERYPDDVLIRICVEKAAMYKIGGEFAGAFTLALDRFEPKQG